MEFQFGTNWSRFSRFSGEVVGQALAMEGVFAFFLESTFLGLVLFGERWLGPRKHLMATAALALTSTCPGGRYGAQVTRRVTWTSVTQGH